MVLRCTSILMMMIVMIFFGNHWWWWEWCSDAQAHSFSSSWWSSCCLLWWCCPDAPPPHLTRSAGHDDGQGDDWKKHWKCKPPLSVMQNQFIWSSRWQRRAIVLVVARVALNLVNWEAPQMGSSTLGVHTSGSGWWLYNEEAYLLCKIYLSKLQPGLWKMCSAKV